MTKQTISRARENPQPRINRLRGFTLIELMVAMVIIGLMLSMAVFSIGDGFHRKMYSEAERLQAVIMAAADEAIYSNSEIGLYFDDGQYQLLRYDAVTRGWVALASRQFTAHQLPENMLIDWTVEGFAKPSDLDDADYVEVEFETSAEDQNDFFSRDSLLDDEPDDYDQDSTGSLANAIRQKTVDVTPQIYLLSSGEQTAFKASFRRGFESDADTVVTVVSDGFAMPYVKTEVLEQ